MQGPSLPDASQRAEARRLYGADPTGYEAGRPDYPERVYELLTTRCGLGPSSAVMEIGPGTGRVTRRLIALGARVVAIEPGLAQRLELDGLAYEAKTTSDRIERLVEIGAIVPGSDGSFQRADVLRSRVVAAFEAEGFSLEQMATAIREHAIVLDSLHLYYPDPSPRTGRSYRVLIEELGPRGELVGSVLSAMGLSAPSPDGQTRVAEEAQLQALIEGWSSVDEQYTVRAARIFGDAARRAAEGWVALFAEAIARPLEAKYEAVDEVCRASRRRRSASRASARASCHGSSSDTSSGR